MVSPLGNLVNNLKYVGERKQVKQIYSGKEKRKVSALVQ